MRLAVVHVFVAAVLGLVMTAHAKADIITFTFTGTGNGALGAQSFSNTAFTITSIADTNLVTNPLLGIYLVPDQTATVNVSGIGTVTFTIPTINVDNQNI